MNQVVEEEVVETLAASCNPVPSPEGVFRTGSKETSFSKACLKEAPDNPVQVGHYASFSQQAIRAANANRRAAQNLVGSGGGGGSV